MSIRNTIGLCLVFGGLSAAAQGSDCDDIQQRLTFHDNGTVSDTESGLTWRRCNMGQQWDGTDCTGDSSELSYAQTAKAVIDRYQESGFRLPSSNELQSISAVDCGEPAVPSQWGAVVSGFYWTSTEAFGGFQTTVLMTNGEQYPMSADIDARALLVR